MDLARKHHPALTRYLARLEVAHQSNITLDPIEDIDHMEAIIEGLNLADPMLNLHFDKMGAEDGREQIRGYVLAKKLEVELRLEPYQRSSDGWREIIDDGEHRIAMGVQCSKSSNDVSIVVIDSRSIDLASFTAGSGRKWDRVRQAITSSIQAKLGPSAPPVRLQVTFFATNTQKSPEGGAIFAISAAKKLASDPAIRTFQDSVLRKMAAGRYHGGVQFAEEGDAARLLPPSLYKHTTSRRVLDQYSMARARHSSAGLDRPDGRVNKKGQTLRERHTAHTIQRMDFTVDYPLLRTYSNSYEAKRIDFIRTALAHLTAQSEARHRQASLPPFPKPIGAVTATQLRANDPVRQRLVGATALNDLDVANHRHVVPNVSTSTTAPAQPIPVDRTGHVAFSRRESMPVDGHLDSRGERASVPDTSTPRRNIPVNSYGSALARALPDSRASSSSAPKHKLSMDLARTHYPALTRYLERLEAAHQSNTALDPIEDIDHMEAIIKGLNITDPMLNLHFDKMGAEDNPEQIRGYVLAKKLEAELWLEPRQRSSDGWREIIDDGEHRVAMGVQCSKSSNDVSIVVIDSRSMDLASFKAGSGQKWQRVLGAITSSIQAKLGPSAPPVRLQVTFFATNTQKSPEGSDIFALSAAKKMASDPAIRMLPSSMLRMMAKGRFHGGIQFVKEGKAAQLLPPSLYKHATSKRVLNDYWVKRMSSSLKGEGPDSKVNKKGQTLLERHAANEIQRPVRTYSNSNEAQSIDLNYPLLRTYSNSYEAKRIDLIRTALASLTGQHLA